MRKKDHAFRAANQKAMAMSVICTFHFKNKKEFKNVMALPNT